MAPAFKPNAQQRRKVELLVGSIPEEGIARLLGIDRSTLRRHFSDELATGRARILSKCLEQLDKAAARGNVAAIKELLRRQAKPDQPAPKAKLGKKQQAQAASETAADGTGWSDLVH